MAGDPFVHPTPEDIISGLGQDLGFNPFDKDEKVAEENQENWSDIREFKKELADNFYACFSTEAGKYVLEFLLNQTLRKSAFVDRAQDGALLNILDTIAHSYVREGQDQIVRLILANMKAAHEGKYDAPEQPKPEEGKNAKKK